MEGTAIRAAKMRVCSRMARHSLAFPSTAISSRGVQGVSSRQEGSAIKDCTCWAVARSRLGCISRKRTARPYSRWRWSHSWASWRQKSPVSGQSRTDTATKGVPGATPAPASSSSPRVSGAGDRWNTGSAVTWRSVRVTPMSCSSRAELWSRRVIRVACSTTRFTRRRLAGRRTGPMPLAYSITGLPSRWAQRMTVR